MGNCQSYDKDSVVHALWKSVRAVPVLPVNPNLAPLRVLTKHRDGYHDVGGVDSVCKPGVGKEKLHKILRSSARQPLTSFGKEYFTTQSAGTLNSSIVDDHGALAKLLVGEANAAAWFSRAKSIQVYIPDCIVSEFRIEKWEEMLRHFDLDVSNPLLGDPDRHGKRKLYIVQKVVLVSHVQITASYHTTTGLNLDIPPVVPGATVQAQVKVYDASSVVFKLSAVKNHRKLPIAFSGFRYTFDKFGNRDETPGRPTRNVPDAAGASFSLEEDSPEGDGPGDEEGSDEDTAANDADMGDILEDAEEDWYVGIISSQDPEEEDEDPTPTPRDPEEIQ